MKSKINNIIPKSNFVKNVLTLVTGTTISHAIPVLISPILSRIYSPEDFGVLAIFISITSILGVISTGRYQLAIVLPKKEEDAINIAALSFVILTVFVALITIGILFFEEKISSFVGYSGNSLYWLYLIPFAVFFIGLYNILNFYNTRKELYKSLAKAKVYKSSFMSLTHLVMGYMKFGGVGLILGQVISHFSANIKLAKNVFNEKRLFNSISKVRIVSNAKKYQDFPKYDMLSAFLNTSSANIITLLSTVFFGTIVVGHISFSQRIISMPASLIGVSISQVLFKEASSLSKSSTELKKLVFSTYKKLFLFCVLPFSFLMFFGCELFAFVFGKDWGVAGSYSQLLSMWVLFVFVNSPITPVMQVLGRQKEFLVFNISLFLARFLILFIGGEYLKNAYLTFAGYGFVGAIFFMFFGFYILKVVGVRYKESMTFTFKWLLLSILLLGSIKYLIDYI